ncbi:MAG TPA: glycosyltransferase family 4 protein [Longimicrobiales bacterium]
MVEGGATAAERPCVLIIGPTPPPYHGMTTFTCMLLQSPVLASAYRVLHLDTADRRTLENMGRFELTNVRLALRHLVELGRLILRQRPDVVLVQVAQNTWGYLRDAVFIAAARALGCRVVTHLNGGHFRDFYQRSNPATRLLVRASSAWIDAAAVLGNGLRQLYDGLVPPQRLHVLPNGIVDPLGGKPPRRERAAGEPVTVTYLGSLYEPKGYLDLIDAARMIDVDAARVRFMFAGPWYAPAEEVEARRRAAGDERIRFLGVVAGEEKRALLEATDILVLPSAYPFEGQPQVILEAMAAAVPVVTTRRAAIPDMVSEGVTGLFVPEHDAGAIAAALRRLLSAPAERMRMGRAARSRYLAEFTDVRCAERLVRILDAARASRRAPVALART